jgi:hypothetical protein
MVRMLQYHATIRYSAGLLLSAREIIDGLTRG